MAEPMDHNLRHLICGKNIYDCTQAHILYDFHVPCRHQEEERHRLFLIHAASVMACLPYSVPSLMELASFFLWSISSFPFAAVVVAKSATKAGSSPAGIATAIGFVPSNRSIEKVGATKGDAFVIAIPIISCSSAIIAWAPAIPK